MKPKSVWVLGKKYSIDYVDKPSDVDIFGRKSLWGQIDYWTTSIRIYCGKNMDDTEIQSTLWHEIVHAIDTELHLGICKELKDETIDLLGMAVADVLQRNEWLK